MPTGRRSGVMVASRWSLLTGALFLAACAGEGDIVGGGDDSAATPADSTPADGARVRCATRDVDTFEQAAVDFKMSQSVILDAGTTITIPVVFHVIHPKSGTTGGDANGEVTSKM